MKLTIFTLSGVWGVPSLIWHGMGDNGLSSGMTRIKNLIEENTQNKAKTIVIGENAEEDRVNGFRTKFLNFLPLRSKKAGRYENLLGFARSNST